MDPLADAIERILNVVRGIHEESQSDYALAGPSEEA